MQADGQYKAASQDPGGSSSLVKMAIASEHHAKTKKASVSAMNICVASGPGYIEEGSKAGPGRGHIESSSFIFAQGGNGNDVGNRHVFGTSQAKGNSQVDSDYMCRQRSCAEDRR